VAIIYFTVLIFRSGGQYFGPLDMDDKLILLQEEFGRLKQQYRVYEKKPPEIENRI